MPEIDLSAHADTLGDPSAYFVSSDDGRAAPLVVEHATGRPRFAVGADGSLSPYVPPRPVAGVVVENPPGFAGFPDHDRDDPAFRPESHGLDPAAYFTHWEADHPAFVAHATGLPGFRVIDGQAVPIGG